MNSELQLIFVYGTLRRGENDYLHWLADPEEAFFVAKAITQSRYPFFVHLLPTFADCAPCVLNKPDVTDACKHVRGELFLVTRKMRAWLEVLLGVEEGVYRPEKVRVELPCAGDAFSTSFRTLPSPVAAFLTSAMASSRTASDGPVVVEPLIYFRHNFHAQDWTEAQPLHCTRLLSSFSAAECLTAYGSDFDGTSAHLRGDAPGVETLPSRAMLARRLQQLPKELWPPTVLAAATNAGEDVEELLGCALLPKPIVLFIIDGIGDCTYAELGGRTPLEVVSGVLPPQSLSPVAVRSTEQLEASSAASAAVVVAGAIETTQRALLSSTASVDASVLEEYSCDGINCVTRSGTSGLMDPYMAGVSCGSDTAHLSMFGYPPLQYYRGRGAYEALGAGLALDDEDVAFKSNFATWLDPEEENEEDCGGNALNSSSGETANSHGWRLVTNRRCDRNFTREGPALCRDLNGTRVSVDVNGVPFDYPHVIKMQYATEHRCGVALSGAITTADGLVLGKLSDKITGTDPLKDMRPLLTCAPTVPPDHPEYTAAVYTSRLVEAASATLSRLLREHPINSARRAANKALREARSCETDDASNAEVKYLSNVILFRGAAKKGWVPSFAARHGLHGVIIAPTCIIKGLGICCGLSSKVCDRCYGADADFSEEVKVADPLEGATGDYHSNLAVKVDAVLHSLRVKCPATHRSCGGYAHAGERSISLHTDTKGEGTERALVRMAAETEHGCGLPCPRPSFAVLHVKGVDDAGHDKSLTHKLEMLRRCGLAMQRLWDSLPVGATMAVVADHSTPLSIGDHCCEPVPVSVATKQAEGHHEVLGDAVERYSEVLARDGALGRFRGEELMPLLKRANTYFHYY